jgi:hypothetical protein
MAFFVVDVRDRVIQRVKPGYNGADNIRHFLIQAGSAKLAWVKAVRASDPTGTAACDSCHHRYCGICEENSLTQRYSDYWICHNCRGLSPRVPTLRSKGGSEGLGQKNEAGSRRSIGAEGRGTSGDAPRNVFRSES